MATGHCFSCDISGTGDTCSSCGRPLWHGPTGVQRARRLHPPGDTQTSPDWSATEPGETEAPEGPRRLVGFAALAIVVTIAALAVLQAPTGPLHTAPAPLTTPEAPATSAPTTTVPSSPVANRPVWRPDPGTRIVAYSSEGFAYAKRFGQALGTFGAALGEIPDGHSLVGVSQSGTLVTMRDGTVFVGPDEFDIAVAEASVSPSGSHLATIDAEGTAKIHSLIESGELLRFEVPVVKPHPDALVPLFRPARFIWSPDESLISIDSGFGAGQVWNLDTGESFEVEGEILALHSSAVALWDWKLLTVDLYDLSSVDGDSELSNRRTLAIQLDSEEGPLQAPHASFDPSGTWLAIDEARLTSNVNEIPGYVIVSRRGTGQSILSRSSTAGAFTWADDGSALIWADRGSLWSWPVAPTGRVGEVDILTDPGIDVDHISIVGHASRPTGSLVVRSEGGIYRMDLEWDLWAWSEPEYQQTENALTIAPWPSGEVRWLVETPDSGVILMPGGEQFYAHSLRYSQAGTFAATAEGVITFRADAEESELIIPMEGIVDLAPLSVDTLLMLSRAEGVSQLWQWEYDSDQMPLLEWAAPDPATRLVTSPSQTLVAIAFEGLGVSLLLDRSEPTTLNCDLTNCPERVFDGTAVSFSPREHWLLVTEPAGSLVAHSMHGYRPVVLQIPANAPAGQVVAWLD